MPGSDGKAVVFNGAGKPLEETRFPIPQYLAKGELLVKVSLSTVCGSDVHTWLGQRPFPTPCILGHEIVGKIVELGDEMERDFSGERMAQGDRIVWSMTVHCGHCFFCTVADLPQKCLSLFKYGHVASNKAPHFTGGFAEYVHLPAGSSIFKIPSSLSDEETAPLMCAGACVVNGMDQAKLGACDYVVVQGCGALGMYSCAFAKERGARNVIAIELIEERRALAREFGADYVIDPGMGSEEDLIKKVLDLTGGRGADFCIEVTGNPEVIPSGIKTLRIGGRYIVLGAIYPGNRFTIDSHDLATKCLQLYGIHNYVPVHLRDTLELVRRSKHKYPFKKLVGPNFQLSQQGVEDALRIQDSRGSLRPAVVPA